MSTLARWLVGIGAFALPAGVTALGFALDHSRWGKAENYANAVPFVAWTALALSVVVPAALILTLRRSWLARLWLVLAVLVLLALELSACFVVVMGN